MRSENQKRADKKYAQKIKGKYKRFSVPFTQEEYAIIDGKIKKTNLTKADFIRKAVNKL